jgi:hypothetical protein
VLQSVTCTLLPAIGFESFVERDRALGNVPVKSESEENLLGDSLNPKSRHVAEPEFWVVIRMPHETASLRVHLFQHRNRSNAVPCPRLPLVDSEPMKAIINCQPRSPTA